MHLSAEAYRMLSAVHSCLASSSFASHDVEIENFVNLPTVPMHQSKVEVLPSRKARYTTKKFRFTPARDVRL